MYMSHVYMNHVYMSHVYMCVWAMCIRVYEPCVYVYMSHMSMRLWAICMFGVQYEGCHHWVPAELRAVSSTVRLHAPPLQTLLPILQAFNTAVNAFIFMTITFCRILTLDDFICILQSVVVFVSEKRELILLLSSNQGSAKSTCYLYKWILQCICQ